MKKYGIIKHVCIVAFFFIAFIATQTLSVSAAIKNTKIDNSGVKYGKYTITLNDNNTLTVKEGKKKAQTIDKNVSAAFLSENNIMLKDEFGFKYYNIKDKGLYNVQPSVPSQYAQYSASSIGLVGFYGDEVLYICGTRDNKTIWAANLRTGEVTYPVGIGGYTVSKAFNSGKYVYIKAVSQEHTSPGTLIRFDLCTQDYIVLSDGAVSAFIGEKKAYYLEYASSTIKFDRKGNMYLKSCDLNGKNSKKIALIENVSIESNIYVTDKFVYYTNSSDQRVQYTIKTGKTKAVDVDKYESPIFNENSLY